MTYFEFIYRFFGWWIINIDLLFVFCFFIGLALLWGQRKKWGKRFLGISVFGFIFFAIVPIGLWTFEQLENRFPKINTISSDTKGIILLGGPFDIPTSLERGERAYNLTLGRFIQCIGLAKEYPYLQLTFTGNEFEMENAKQEFKVLGLDPSQIQFAESAKDTKENAMKMATLLDPQPNEKWILVTSAYHMPRSVGLFRKAGFNVIPYPVDYHAPGKYEMWFFLGLQVNLQGWQASAREWLGMLINYLMRRSDDLFPKALDF